MHIKDRTFIVSGGSSGLGLATCHDLHAQGGYVAVLDISQDAGIASIEQLGSDRARFFCTDVSDTSSITSAISSIKDWIEQTARPIAGVISAAGVGNPGKIIDRHGEPLAMSSIDFVLNINLRGTLDLVRQCLPMMTTTQASGADGERGVIVLVSSSAAYDGQPGQVSYAASKGAIRSLTLPLSRDLAQYGIRVVTIAPSLFESGMTALMSDKVRTSLERVMEFPKRAGRPEEFAALVSHVVGNSMLNGVTMRLDGAMRMPSRL